MIVEIFVEWLYTGLYPKDSRFCLNCSTGSCDYECSAQLARVKVCEFGDRFQANEFKLASEEALVDSIIDDLPWYNTIIYAFKHLPPNNPILQAMIDKHCLEWNDKIDNKGDELDLRSKLPYEFWMGVSLRYMRMQDGQIEELDRRDYYRHESDVGGKGTKLSSALR